MKLESLKLEHFRCHKKLEIEFGELTELRGPSGVGKSTILDAIVTLWTGRNRFTSPTGQGLREDIAVGAAGFTLSGQAQANGSPLSATRKVTPKLHDLSFKDAPTNVAVAQGLLLASLGVSSEAVLAALDSKGFLDREVKEQQQFLLKLLSPAEIQVPASARAVGIEEIRGAAELDKKIKELKEGVIRDLNRKVNEDEVKVSTPKPGRIVASVKNEISRLESDLSRLDKLAGSRENLEMRIRGLQARKVEGEKKLAMAKQARAKVPIEDIESLRQSAADADARSQAASKELSELQGGARRDRETLSLINEMGSKCGVTPVFDCPLDAKDRDKMHETIEARIREQDAKIAEAAMRLGQTSTDAKDYGKRALEQETLNDVVASSEELIRAFERDIKEIQKELSAMPETGDRAAIVKMLDSARKELSQAERFAQESAAATVHNSEHRQAVEKLEKYTLAVADLVELKNSITSDDRVSRLIASVESALPGRKVEIAMQPFTIKVGGVDAQRLSSGQKVLFDIALRLAAAEFSGVGIVALDDAIRVNPAALEHFHKYNRAAAQTILCVTADGQGIEVSRLGEGVKASA